MKIIWGMADGRGYLIKSRKRSGKIKSVVTAANEESNSMHDEIANYES